MMRFICFLIGSGSLIGMMLLTRVILRGRIPAGILYALWLVPAIRLLIPFTLIPVPVLPEDTGETRVFDDGDEEAVVVPVTIAEYAAAAVRVAVAECAAITDHAAYTENAQDTEIVGTGGITEAVSLTAGREDLQGEVHAEGMQQDQRMGIRSYLSWIWLSGSILCGSYVIWINRRLQRSIKQMKRLPEDRLVPVYIRNETVSPCLFGFLHPCILLSKQTAENREVCCHALLHEETHYRQKDHIWTAFRIFLCIIYWWNPLVWLGAACAREDAEFACDERALKGAALSEKKAYGYALLEIVEGAQNAGTLVQGITSVSGKGKNMKRRLENIVSENKRTSVWPLPVCLLLLLFLCGLCFPAQRARAEEETIQEPGAEEETIREPGAEEEMIREPEAEEETLREANAEEETIPGPNAEAERAPEPVKQETADQVKSSETENAQEDRTEEQETGLRLHPQEHREGYREPALRYTASAGWLTDLTDRPDEQEKTENLARRALRELYDLTGYQVEECFYGYHEIGMLVFSRNEEDMLHSRVFYSYSMGEKDGYDMISSIDIVSAERVWYSDVQQLALPENAESMEKEELALWFLEHSPLCPEGKIVQIEPIFASGPGCFKLTMEDGTFYEIDIDVETLAVNNIYGPYPRDAQH